jgi:hypothetical protein
MASPACRKPPIKRSILSSISFMPEGEFVVLVPRPPERRAGAQIAPRTADTAPVSPAM